MRIVLTNNARFNPYTFDEMLKPLAMAADAYNTVQSGIEELGAKADLMKMYANEVPDSKVANMYNSYAENLEKQANMLAKHGLTPASRKALLDLKRGYTSQIVPIEQAYAARAEEAKSQYAGRAQGIVYEGDAATSSLDRYLDNPNIRYNYANSQEGFKRVATVASALAKGLRNYGNGNRLDDYTKTWLQEHGYKDTEVDSAISDIRKIINGDTDVQSNGVLRAILNDEMNAAGINTWTNRAAVNDYFNRVAPALYQAVGETKVLPYEDYGNRNPPPQLKGVALSSRSVYSKKHRSQAEAEFVNNKKAFSQYFNVVDGKHILNDKGKAELERNDTPRVTIAGSGGGTAMLMNAETQYQSNYRFFPTKFKKFMDSLGMTNDSDAGSLWDKYINDPVATTAGYDAKKYIEFPHRIDPSEQNVWKDNLLKTAVNGKLREVEFDSETGQYKETGETLSVENLNKKGYRVFEVVMSNLGPNGKGNTTTIIDDKGHAKTYKLEPGINEPNEEAITSYVNYASQLEQIPDEGGYIQDRYGRLVFVTKEEAEAEHDMILQSAKAHLSQLGLTNKTKSQEFGAYTW